MTSPVHLAFVRPDARKLYAQRQDDFLAPATALSAGFDLRACFDAESIEISPGSRFLVPTGISVQPQQPGLAGFVYSRSGLGARDGLTIAQGVGVIDPDYTGEVLVMLLNTSNQTRTITRGERVAQILFQPYVRPLWQEVPELTATSRGAGGFGHTGR